HLFSSIQKWTRGICHRKHWNVLYKMQRSKESYRKRLLLWICTDKVRKWMKSWKSVILTVSPSSKMRLNHSEVHIKVEIAGHLGSSAFFLLTATKLLQLLVVAHSYQMIQKPSRKRHSSLHKLVMPRFIINIVKSVITIG